MQYETKKRSILKAISWRTWATLTTAVLVYIFTGEFALALTIIIVKGVLIERQGFYAIINRHRQLVESDFITSIPIH